ncbi:hypothetical protein [Formosa algae]|uniref:hypothetical protein n=1 Tax=Formosa algae TaxID=225843 RepID=UPI000CCF74AF|nr:hypothetical protein [Formosa algae]PNW27559.1 hypothetical protein BKP44_12140 [Formosa algae]
MEKFINEIYSSSNYSNALKILLTLFNNSIINQPSVLFVVLETITEEILKNKSKIHYEKHYLKNDCISLLNKYKETLSKQDFDILYKGISQIDKKILQNNKNHILAFEILGIDLSKEDKICLGKRNDFFHGRILPQQIVIDNEDDFVTLEKEYSVLSQRLFTLITKLVLKTVNFEGFIINHAKIREIQNDKTIEEDYFIKI